MVRTLRAQFAVRRFVLQMLPLVVLLVGLIFCAPCAPDFGAGMEFDFDSILRLPRENFVSNLGENEHIPHSAVE